MKTTIEQTAYQRGREDGFQLGKTQGFQQGWLDASKSHVPQEKSQDTYSVLVIAPGPLPTVQIGIHQPFEALRKRGVLNYTLKYSGEVSQGDVAHSTHVVFVRTVEPESYKYLEWAHEAGKKTIYYIDDHFLAIPPDTDIGMHYLTPERIQHYLKFLKNVHVVKVDSSYFGNYIRQYFNSNVVYFPASVDLDSLASLERPREHHDKIIIGYEGGNKEEAFMPVVPALMEVLDYYGGMIELQFYGFVPSALANYPNVKYTDLDSDYPRFLKKLYQCGWDIGLAPLENHHFHHCKTNNKFREYSACWIPGIYSNVPPYAEWVHHGENGLLVDHSTEAWYEAIVKLIEDRDLRLRMKEQARATALAHFTVQACAERWMTQIFQDKGA